MTWGEPKVEVLMDVRVSVVDEPDDHVPMERESEMRTRHANVVTADVALRRNEAADVDTGVAGKSGARRGMAQPCRG